MSIRIEILNDPVFNVLQELEKMNLLRILDEPSDKEEEQTREIIGRAPNVLDRPAIQNEFITILHRHLDEIGLTGELIITDPFILNCFPNALNWYKRFLGKLFEPLYEKVQVITFFVKSCDSDVLWNQLKTHAQTKGCMLRYFVSNEYHDRFWLCATHKRGVFVGNSLTGIGAKYCFVGRLPDADALAAYHSLEEYL